MDEVRDIQRIEFVTYITRHTCSYNSSLSIHSIDKEAPCIDKEAPCPEKMRFEVVIGMQNAILDGHHRSLFERLI